MRPWTDSLVYDVALALEGNLPDLSPVVHRHGVDPEDFLAYLTDPVFLKAILAMREEISVKGVLFQMRARSLVEDALLTTHRLSRDVDVSPSVRLQSAQSIVRWAGHDKPEAADAAAAANGGGVKINITIGGDHRSVTLVSDPKPTLDRPADDY